MIAPRGNYRQNHHIIDVVRFIRIDPFGCDLCFMSPFMINGGGGGGDMQVGIHLKITFRFQHPGVSLAADLQYGVCRRLSSKISIPGLMGHHVHSPFWFVPVVERDVLNIFHVVHRVDIGGHRSLGDMGRSDGLL